MDSLRSLLFLAAPLALAASSCVAPPLSADPAIRSEELSAKVHWLAADAREGRRTGTEGERVSAAWIIERLQAAGVQPGGENGSWIQEFPVQMAPEEGECSLMGAHLDHPEVHTVAASRSTTVTAALVVAHYGVVMESHGMNDFEDAGVEGSIALIRRYTEMGPDADPTMAALGNLRQKVKNAAAAGAVGVILGTHPDDMARAGEEWIPFEAIQGSMPIPVLVVSSDTFAALELAAQSFAIPEMILTAAVQRETHMARNVLGFLPGQTDEVMVIGGHYDHLGWGGEGSLAPGVHEIHNGADDNASGTAMVLELAERWGGDPTRHPQRGMLFALWSGEEEGLLGSAWWVDHPTVDLEQVVANLNLDMVGRLGEGRVTVGSAETCAAFKPALTATQEWMTQKNLPLELNVIQNEMPGGGGSDHMSFHKVDRAAVFFFSGLHSDYHKPTDDADKLSYNGMAVLGLVLDHFLQVLDGMPSADFQYQKPQADPHGGGGQREVASANVWFGSIPDYGAAPAAGGMQIAGTSPGSPAEKAGLLNGDIILQVGEVMIGDIYDFMDALGKYQVGQTVEVRVLRDDKEVTMPLTFFPRASNGD